RAGRQRRIALAAVAGGAAGALRAGTGVAAAPVPADLARAAGHLVAAAVDTGPGRRADLAGRAGLAGAVLDANAEHADRPFAGDAFARVDADAKLTDLTRGTHDAVAPADAGAGLADLAGLAGDARARRIYAEAVGADERRAARKFAVAAGTGALALHTHLTAGAEPV